LASALEAGASLVPKEAADTAFDATTCIGCGAAACPNAAATLFTSFLCQPSLFRLKCVELLFGQRRTKLTERTFAQKAEMRQTRFFREPNVHNPVDEMKVPKSRSASLARTSRRAWFSAASAQRFRRGSTGPFGERS
jgi:ferredoxin